MHPADASGRALAELESQMIPAYSPQARGEASAALVLGKVGLPAELRLTASASLASANEFVRESYIEEFNNISR